MPPGPAFQTFVEPPSVDVPWQDARPLDGWGDSASYDGAASSGRPSTAERPSSYERRAAYDRTAEYDRMTSRDRAAGHDRGMDQGWGAEHDRVAGPDRRAAMYQRTPGYEQTAAMSAAPPTSPPAPTRPQPAARGAVPDLVPARVAPPDLASGRDIAPAGPAGAPASAGGGELELAAPPAKKRRPRDRYVDLLRSIAIVRVIANHTFNLWWMGLFPAMGMMFALAGSMMAASIDKSPKKAVTSRFTRMLPPLWLLGAVIVPLMLLNGWKPAPDDPNPIGWYLKVLFWIAPIDTPPGSQWGFQTTEVLWYIRTYIWFIALSPALLPLFRKIPRTTVLTPLIVVALLSSGEFGDGPVFMLFRDLSTYAACWLIGFAHHDGMIKRVRAVDLYVIGFVLMAIGLWWGFTHVNDEGKHDLNDLPFGQAFYSLGFVMILLRYSSQVLWLKKAKFLNGLVTLLNSRALTIYLWHNTMIAIAPNIDDFIFQKTGAKYSFLESTWFMTVMVVILVCLSIMVFGWLEDVVAKRKPRIWPWPKQEKNKPDRSGRGAGRRGSGASGGRRAAARAT